MSRRAQAWIDGASRGNPGDAAFGVLIETDSETHEIGGYLGRATNNVAEYSGLIAALAAAKHLGIEDLAVASDSELLVRQIQGRYRVKAPHLLPYYNDALRRAKAMPRFAIRHVMRGENSRADGLANRAIDAREPLPEWLELPGVA